MRNIPDSPFLIPHSQQALAARPGFTKAGLFLAAEIMKNKELKIRNLSPAQAHGLKVLEHATPGKKKNENLELYEHLIPGERFFL